MEGNSDCDRLLPQGVTLNSTTGRIGSEHGDRSNRNGSAYQTISGEHTIEIEPAVSKCKL